MIQHGDRAVERGYPNRLAVGIGMKLALLREEVAVGSPTLALYGLCVMALGLQTIGMLSPGHFRLAPNPLFAVLVAGSTLLSLAVCLSMSIPIQRVIPVAARVWLSAIGLGLVVILGCMGAQNIGSGFLAVQAGHPYTNDGAVMDLYAAGRVMQGKDPYLTASILGALADMNAPCTTTTPLMDGQFRGTTAYPSEAAVQAACMNVIIHRPRSIPPEFESKYNYPSGSFLFILPFLWMGIHDMRFLYALAILAMGAYLAFRMPRSLRFLVAPLLLADVPLIRMTAGGQPDTMYGALVLVGYAEWSSPWISPLCLGLAIGTKQLAWFFVPFYLLLVLRHFGWREVTRRAGIMAAVFLVMNALFIAESPNAYLNSLAAPMTDPMFPLGIGIIALMGSGLLPILPKVVFAVMELLAWMGGLLTTARLRMFGPAAGIVLAAFPLFFAWRSLTNYFYLVPLLTIAVVLADAQRRLPQRT